MIPNNGGQRAERFRVHLETPRGRGVLPPSAAFGAAGGAACGDRLLFAVWLEDREGVQTVRAGFEAAGCGALTAAASAAVQLVEGRPFLEAAQTTAAEIDRELGGLSPAKAHAVELAEEGIHRALGAALTQVTLPREERRVVVGLSGGVDSAVAAVLLKEQGYRPVGVTFELWRDPENDPQRSCCSAQAVRSARRLARQLEIPHLTVDLRERFRHAVVERWVEEHRTGLTPYPCLRCNGEVRFSALAAIADNLGAPWIATGHYARLVEKDGKELVARGMDPRKDQSYPLAALPEAVRSRLLLPLGGLKKGEVRGVAARLGLEVAGRPDSQDLCFLAGTTRERLLARLGGIEAKEGPIQDRQGKVLGRHRGFAGYTVGQRKGLGIGGKGPLFVLAVDPRQNAVVVGPREELLVRELPLVELHLYLPAVAIDGARIRSRGGVLPAQLEAREGGGLLRFPQPVERTAPGQLACLYSGEVVAGWGIIAGERP